MTRGPAGLRTAPRRRGRRAGSRPGERRGGRALGPPGSGRPYAARDLEPHQQLRLGLTPEPGRHCYGVATTLEDWLADIAAHVFTRAGFRLVVMDFQLDADYDEWRSWTPETVPAHRRVGLILTTGGEPRSYRRTVWA